MGGMKARHPLQDASAGIAPRNAVPGFAVGIGRSLMSTCHDTTIPELARDGLAGRGDDPVADLALQDPLCGARAIESRSTSSRPVTVMPSDAVAPLGAVRDRIATPVRRIPGRLRRHRPELTLPRELAG